MSRLNGRRRVAITGIGCVTPIGTGVEGLRRGLAAGRSAVRPVTRFDPSPFRSRVAAEIAGFDPLDYVEKKRARRLDRFGQLGVAAARLALHDAELEPGALPADRVAVQMGSALGGVAFAEAQHLRYLADGARAVDPTLALLVFTGAASCHLAIEFGFTGPNETNAMSCAAGAVAIGRAMRLLRNGEADIALAGGAEAPLSPLCFGAFAILRAMSSRNDDPAAASRPFDRDRDGFVMGEGAAVLVLESWEFALRRGARIYAEVCGFGITSDAYHMTAPRPDGEQSARAMCDALRDARISPDEVEYVNAHGSSTPLNDPTETLAIKQVFGDHARQLTVGGTKGYYGHALGASGAIEAAICALSLHGGWIPPTVNLEDPDPECDLDYVRSPGVERRVDTALSNSFGFGGINACLAFRSADAERP